MTIRESSTAQAKVREASFGVIASTHERFSHPTRSKRQFAADGLWILKEQLRAPFGASVGLQFGASTAKTGNGYGAHLLQFRSPRSSTARRLQHMRLTTHSSGRATRAAKFKR
jgi:hypothetical protein